MATQYWNSQTSEWIADSFSGRVLPIDGDTVYLDARSSKSLITSLDRTGDSAGVGLKLAKFETLADFRGDIGAVGQPLKLRCSTAGGIGQFIHRSPGKLYFVSASGSGSAVTDRIIIDTPNLNHEITLPNQATEVTVLRGKAKNNVPGVAYTRLFVGYQDNSMADAYVTMGDQYEGVRVYQFGGHLIFKGSAGTEFGMSGGYLQLDGNSVLYIQSGGHCDFGVEFSSATPFITTAYLLNGSMDTTRAALGQTITTAYISPQFELKEDGKLTITNRVKLWE